MEIFGLVGPSGTGKSHRASFVAHRLAAEAIIDDGLLIYQARILAGVSAKREDTRMAATRRAILEEPGHAQAIRDALQEVSVSRLLVLGTSVHMIERILEALHMADHPWQLIRIDEVATPEEIATARNIRLTFGKHVIPAPTLEVKKSFTGYLVNPLRFIVRHRDRSELVEKSVVRPTFSGLGRFYIADSVLMTLAQEAARHVDGVHAVERIRVSSQDGGIRVTIDVELSAHVPVLATLSDLQTAVQQLVESSTALNVMAVDVATRHIEGGLAAENRKELS